MIEAQARVSGSCQSTRQQGELAVTANTILRTANDDDDAGFTGLFREGNNAEQFLAGT
jgi:hypothetical protein